MTLDSPLPPVAIGDIHGRLDLLDAAIARFPGRHLVLLGDYADRGPDSRGVIARVRELVEAGRATALLGNHDEMLIHAARQPDSGSADWWLTINGGQATLDSYGHDWAALTADAQWLEEHLLQHVTIGPTLFAHALRPDPDGQDDQAHLWGRPTDASQRVYPLPDGVNDSVHGHTPLVDNPQAFTRSDGSRTWFIDTGAFMTGILGALDTATWKIHLIREAVPA